MKIYSNRKLKLLFVVLGGFMLPVMSQATCVPPPTDLVGWWPGDGNANDISGGLHNGTGGVFIPGKVAQAFSIGGIEANAVRVANYPNLESANTVTVDAWVRHNGTPADYQWIVAKGASGCDSASYGLYYAKGSADQTRMIVYGADNTFGVAGITAPSIYDGNWHFLTGTYDGSTVKLYVDGVVVASNPYSQPIKYGLTPDNDLLIGDYNHSACPPGNNYAFIGDIDEVEVFNRALSSTEIADIYNAGSDGKCKFQTIAIDIKPGSYPNCFNINSNGVIPVALLGSASFNVNNVNVGTLSFNGLTVSMRGKGALCHIENVNGDSYPDMVCQFQDDVTAWQVGTSTGIVKGNLNNGTPFQGQDSICVKP